jgi:acyl-CoA synthetase (AMP-forming)/AMP-acid ligase II
MTVNFDNFVDEKKHFATLVDLLSYRAKENSAQKAYTFLQRGEIEANSLTYKELDRQAKAIALSLQSLGVVGERALLLYPPGLDFIAAFFGCLYAGVVAVPAYPPRRNQNMSRLQTLVTDAQAKIGLTTASLLTNVENRFTENREFQSLHWLTTDNIVDEPSYSWQKPELKTNTLAFLQYTSGSTGIPKGVMVTHGNLMHNGRMIERAFGYTADTIVVSWLPLFHDMGLIGNVLQSLYIGKLCILMSPADFVKNPLRWLQAISHYRATASGGPNFAYDLCIRKITPEQKENLDLSCWEMAYTGAEPVRAETLENFASYFADCGFRKEAFYPCYGMAETTLLTTGGLKESVPIVEEVTRAALEENQVVTSANKQDNIRRIVSCGKSWLDQKILIVDPESRIQCQANRVGEIWVSGSSVAKGYWQKPLETQQTFNAYLADTCEGPFLRTGDLGFVKNSELFVTGRIKDVIIIRGQNHYPQDIELSVEKSHSALRTNSGAVFTADINGLEELIVVQELERSYLRKLDLDEVVGSIRQAVTAEHALQVYALVLVKTGSIPKTSSGKIKRYACKSEFLKGNLNTWEDWSKTPRGKTRFRHLNAEIELMLQKLQAK